jgi:hypothetical protein
VNVLDVIARSAYECTVCGALWPHPSFKCSGIGGFADHPEARTVLVKVVDDDDYRGAVERCAEADRLLRIAYADCRSPEDVPMDVLAWLTDMPGGQ